MKKNLWKAIALAAVVVVITGFDLENTIVPRSEILSGGPPKDGIPAILDPKFVAGSDADFLKESDSVIGVEINGEARAYPIRILNMHEIVNDTVNGEPIAVTF